MFKEVENLEEFEALLKEAGDKLVVVDFSAIWCGPCKMIGPKFDELSRLPENNNVIFLKVDVDNAPDVSEKCNISCMPTFQFFKRGVKVDEFSGANKETLVKKLEENRT
uniref:thioredoxin b n=1 Tax=Semicossyphus pulcher TaxID=241346 RepID=UPI0037E78FD3